MLAVSHLAQGQIFVNHKSDWDFLIIHFYVSLSFRCVPSMVCIHVESWANRRITKVAVHIVDRLSNDPKVATMSQPSSVLTTDTE